MATKKSPSRTAANRPANTGAHRFLIPTGGGSHAYVRSAVTGLNPLLKVGTEQFEQALAENVAAGFGERIRSELAAMHAANPASGWDKVLRALPEAA
jgi:hypothetical protein